MDCYKKFTALPKLHRVSNETSCNEQQMRCVRSEGTTPKAKEITGVFPAVCLFCCSARKKLNHKEQKLVNVETMQFATNIQYYADMKDDQELLTKIKDTDFVAKEVRYHACCRSKYQSEARAVNIIKQKGENEQKNYFKNEKRIHSEAFDALVNFIEENIIEKREVHLLSDINDYYIDLVRDIGGQEFQDAAPTAQRLQEKIGKYFKERIKVEKGKTKKGNIVYSSMVSLEEAMELKHNELLDRKVKIRDIALMLRESIKNERKRPLPSNLTIDDLYKGEVDVPEMVFDFFRYLIGGPDSRNWKHKQRRIMSISQDAVFSATSGNKKPAKHLVTALAIKSLTGSRKVIEMLNRLGHCSSYHTAEELETELTFETKASGTETPYGMILAPEYGMGTVWDNFDRFVETMSGKDTLHDTVGIAYQLVEDKGYTSQETVISDTPSSSCPKVSATPPLRVDLSKKRRRTYETCTAEIEPYRKKPKLNKPQFLPVYDPRLVRCEETNDTESWKKVLWLIDVDVNVDTPMWVGWNAKLVSDNRKVMKIWYLPQINQSPTSNAVVVETMKRSMSMALESKKKSIAVTYDLAIAKLAMQIQAEEQSKYDNLFIALGSFHIEMAFFSAIGKLIAESGGPHILNECGALAKGSINGFIKGKNYKRCKRMHELLALALETLLFELFLSKQEAEEIGTIIRNELVAIKKGEKIESHKYSREATDILQGYKKFCEKTSKGDNGQTAQFWSEYIHIMHLYHEYSRSVRMGDLESYIVCLPKMANYFFALNHPNYARWTTKYHDNLLKLKETHPEVYEEFRNCFFRPFDRKLTFSGNPIDLTLEQTINKDAASQQTGIAALTNSISARQRWAESHFIRSSIISHVFDELGINKKEDVTAGLKRHVIQNDNHAVRKILGMTKEMMNPFSADLDHSHLYNLGTGKADPDDVEQFLLTVTKIGEKERLKFMDECRKDATRFENKITRQKMVTFATTGKKKLQGVSGKVVAACMVRNLFGSILNCSLKQKIDMAEVLKYPLTPVPLSLSHVDGTMQKTPKAALLKYLRQRLYQLLHKL